MERGAWSLDRLLSGKIDKRLGIAKTRAQLEADFITEAGGPDYLSPTLIVTIKRLVHKSLVLDQLEKMALLGEFYLTDKRYVCLSNYHGRDVDRFRDMLKDRPTKRVATLAEILEAESHES